MSDAKSGQMLPGEAMPPRQSMRKSHCEELKRRVKKRLASFTWKTWGPEARGGTLREVPYTEMETGHIENVLISQPLDAEQVAAFLLVLRTRRGS